MRVAGLPVRALVELRAERTWQRIGRLRERRYAWRRESQRLVDVLELHIGGIGPGELRGLLVALRRAVFGGRPLSGRINPAGLGAALPSGLAGDLLAWQGERAWLAGEVERLPAVLAAEVGGCVAAVRGWMAEDAVRHGLWHASPVLAGELEKWLAAVPGVRPERKVVLRLARYLSRVASKTSPFAGFTAWGLGRFGEAAPRSPATAAIVQADAGFTQRCAWTLAGQDETGSRLPLRLNSSAVFASEAVVFLGAAAGEPVHELRLTPMVRACLEAVRSHAEPSAEDVCELLGASENGPSHAELRRFVAALVELGLMEQRLPFADQDADPWGAIRNWPQVPVQLREAAADLDERLRHASGCAEARRTADRVRRVLGPGDEPSARPGGELIRHDAVLAEPLLVGDEDDWRPILADLDALRPWAGLAEASLPLRLTASAWAIGALGPSGSLPYLSFYRRLCGAGVLEPDGSLRSELASARASGATSDLRLLGSLRQRARDLLYARPATGPSRLGDPGGCGGTWFDQWQAMTRAWPSWVQMPASLSCFVQLTPTGVVLNGMATGYGRARSRAQALADAANGGGDGGGRYLGDVLVAEVDGLFGSGLNRRRPAAAFAIDYPYTRSRRPAEQVIPLSDLVVAWRGGGLLTLSSPRHDRQVRPVHLGGVADGFLPPALRLLVRLFGDFTAPYRPTWLLGEDDDPWAHQGVRHTPRAEIGRLVLSRAAWWMRARDLPCRGTGESDAHLMLRWADFFAAHAIPERCFIRALTGQNKRAGHGRSEHKPLYLDLASPLLLGGVERELSAPDARVVVHEALPDPAHTPISAGDRDHRTTELVIEVNGPEVAYG